MFFAMEVDGVVNEAQRNFSNVSRVFIYEGWELGIENSKSRILGRRTEKETDDGHALPQLPDGKPRHRELLQ
jgi:hypothetical protein